MKYKRFESKKDKDMKKFNEKKKSRKLFVLRMKKILGLEFSI